MAAASGDSDLSRNLRDQFLQCRICLEGLKDPKTLPCLHTFCAQCLAYYIDYNRLDHRKFACPICRRHIYIPKDGVGAFPDSFFVQSLNDALLSANSSASAGSSSASEAKAKKNECNICRFKNGNVTATVINQPIIIY